VEQLGEREGAAAGAALLAGVGAGVWPDVAAACAAVPIECRQVAASPDASEQLAAAHAVYDDLYATLKPSFARLAGESMS
jgi:xylulokinase